MYILHVYDDLNLRYNLVVVRVEIVLEVKVMQFMEIGNFSVVAVSCKMYAWPCMIVV